MTRYHPDGDLAPRDVVARSIVREIGARPAAPCFSRSPISTPDYVRRRVSDDCRHVPAGRPRSRARSDSGRSGGALHHGRRRHRRVGAHVDARPVRGGRGRPARACTARIAWRATRCSKVSCSARAPAIAMQQPARGEPGRAVAGLRRRRPLLRRPAAADVRICRRHSRRRLTTPERPRSDVAVASGLFRTRRGAGRRPSRQLETPSRRASSPIALATRAGGRRGRVAAASTWSRWRG